MWLRHRAKGKGELGFRAGRLPSGSGAIAPAPSMALCSISRSCQQRKAIVALVLCAHLCTPCMRTLGVCTHARCRANGWGCASRMRRRCYWSREPSLACLPPGGHQCSQRQDKQTDSQWDC